MIIVSGYEHFKKEAKSFVGDMYSIIHTFRSELENIKQVIDELESGEGETETYKRLKEHVVSATDYFYEGFGDYSIQSLLGDTYRHEEELLTEFDVDVFIDLIDVFSQTEQISSSIAQLEGEVLRNSEPTLDVVVDLYNGISNPKRYIRTLQALENELLG